MGNYDKSMHVIKVLWGQPFAAFSGLRMTINCSNLYCFYKRERGIYHNIVFMKRVEVLGLSQDAI